MKKAILAVCLLSISFTAFSQSKSVEALYQKYKGTPDFFHLDLSGSFMNILKDMNIHLDKINKDAITQSVERIKMFKLPVGESTGNTDFKTLRKALASEKFELMMEAAEKKNSVWLYTKGNKQIRDIVLMIQGNSGDFMVIELEGEFDAKSLANAGNSINF